jgi:hypothetical protein
MTEFALHGPETKRPSPMQPAEVSDGFSSHPLFA